MGTLFSYNLIIKSFDELRYFTITSLGQNAFRNCSLEHLTLPATLSSIGSDATYYMWRLRYISILRQTPPTLGTGNFDTFYGNIYVPDGSVSSYQSSWSSVTAVIKAISDFDEHVTKYDGVKDKVFVNENGEESYNWWSSAVVFLPVNPGDSITVQTSRVVLGNRLNVYNSNKELIDYWSMANMSLRTLTMRSNMNYLRINFRTVWLDDCYIKNNTTGKYLFKGENVP